MLLAISSEREGGITILEDSALSNDNLVGYSGITLGEAEMISRGFFVCAWEIVSECEELSVFFFLYNLSYAAHATCDQLESRAHSIEEIRTVNCLPQTQI